MSKRESAGIIRPKFRGATVTATLKIRNLPCKLTPEEVTQRVARLVDRLARKEGIQAERQKAVQLAYRELKEVDAEVASLKDNIAAGQEIREVEVLERKDLDRRVLEVVRRDTGEVVDSRQLSIEELQTDLPFERAEGERATSYSARKGAVLPFRANQSSETGPEPAPEAEPPADGKRRRRARAQASEASPPLED